MKTRWMILSCFLLMGCVGVTAAGYWSGDVSSEPKFSVEEAYKAAADGDQDALSKLRKAADRGHAESQYCLGLLYINGFGVEKNHSEALKLVTQAGENGFIPAQMDLAYWYHYGCGKDSARIVVEQSNAKALYWYKKAAESGDARAMFDLAKVYRSGKITLRNPEAAAEWMHRAANAGSVLAMSSLASMYEVGNDGVEKNPEEALKWYSILTEYGKSTWVHERARRGDKKAQLVLAWIYENGIKGVKQDLKKARELYSKIGALELGKFYMKGYGKYAEQNTQKAIGYFKQAVQQREVEAPFLLAEAYEKENRPEEACEWYLEAARNGNVVALERLEKFAEDDVDLQVDLSTLYDKGNNFAKSIKWTRKAVDGGSAKAQFRLAMAYAEGKGVPKNMSKAVKWCREGMRRSGGELNMETLLREEGLKAVFQKQAMLGDFQAQCGLAMVSTGQIFPEDPAEQMAWLRKQAEAENAPAQGALGLLLHHQQATEDAQKWLLQGAEGGDALSQISLGVMYYTAGQHDLAAPWILKAADQGCAPAQYQIARMFLSGDGVDQSTVEAINYAQRAVNQGYAKANSTLNEAHEKRAKEVEYAESKYQEGKDWVLRVDGWVRGPGSKRIKVERSSKIPPERKAEYLRKAIACFREAADLGHKEAAEELKKTTIKLNKLMR